MQVHASEKFLKEGLISQWRNLYPYTTAGSGKCWMDPNQGDLNPLHLGTHLRTLTLHIFSKL